MPSIVDSVRQQADKAAFEADKLIRIRREQAVVDQLRRDLRVQLDALGQIALTVYRRGEITHPELVAVGQRMDALDDRIKQREKAIEQIRAEQFVVAPPQPTQPCPRCGKPAPTIATFCPHCGGPIPKPAPAGAACRICGAMVPASAAFCPACGAKKVAEAPAPAPRCANCGATLTTGALFCPDCGTRAGTAASAAAAPIPLPLPAVEPVPPLPTAAVAPAAEVEAPSASFDLPAPAPYQAPVEPIAPVAPAGKNCPNCQTRLPQEAIFCPDCGTRLA